MTTPAKPAEQTPRVTDADCGLGIALGNAVAGYRDHDTKRCAEGLIDAVNIVRRLEDRLDKQKWQILDTCSRAEKAEASLRAALDREAATIAKLAERETRIAELERLPPGIEAVTDALCDIGEQDLDLAEEWMNRATAAEAELKAAREAIAVALPQAEGCFATHYGNNPEGAAEPEHIRLMRAALSPPTNERA